MRRYWIYFLLILLAVAIAVAIWYFYFSQKKKENVLTLFGNVDVRQVDLGFKVTGRVATMLFEEGDLVQRGTLMASLDKQPYFDQVKQSTASLLSAQTVLKNSEDLLDRRQRLRSSGGVSIEDYENALSTRNVDFTKQAEAEAALGVAETNLRDTEIFCPIEGTILTRVREPGTVVNIGESIYTLSVLSPVWIRAFVTEPELGLICPGMAAKIYTDSQGHRVYDGHIGFISPVSEFTPKTVETTQLRTDLVYRIRVVADNPDCFLKQGMPVTVRIELPKLEKKKFENAVRGS